MRQPIAVAQPGLWDEDDAPPPKRVPRKVSTVISTAKDEQDDLALELVSVGDALGYRRSLVLAALDRLKPRHGERAACALLMDRMLARRPIYGKGPARES